MNRHQTSDVESSHFGVRRLDAAFSQISDSSPRIPDSGPRSPYSVRGFTLIELLVAMAILVIITLIVARIFQQSTVAWNTGLKKTESTMTGRAVADFIAQQLSHAVPDTNGASFAVSGLPMTFFVLEEASPGTGAIQQVSYDKTDLAEGIVDVRFDSIGTPPSGGLPAGGVVTVTVTNDSTIPIVFQSGVYFHHRDRNRL